MTQTQIETQPSPNPLMSAGALASPTTKLPETPEAWAATLKAKTEQFEKAKEHYVAQKAAVAAAERAISDRNWSADEITENQDEYDQQVKRLAGEKQSLAFAQANRAMAQGEMHMCRAHMDALGVKAPRKPRTAAYSVRIEDSEEVKAQKAVVAGIESRLNEARTKVEALRSEFKTVKEEWEGKITAANNERLAVFAEKTEAVTDLAKIDPNTKPPAANTGGRKSKYSGHTVAVVDAKAPNDYDVGTAKHDAYNVVRKAKTGKILYEHFKTQHAACKPGILTGLIDDGKVTVTAPAKPEA